MMKSKALLEKYYEILSQKGDCAPLLSDGFSLSGAGLKSATGQKAHSDSLFFRYAKLLKTKTMIIDGEGADGVRACVIVNYVFESPKSESVSLEVAEIWKIDPSGKLASLEMFFDTVAYQNFMLPILFPLTRLKKKSDRLSSRFD